MDSTEPVSDIIISKTTEEQLPQEITKHSFRQKVWDHLMENKLINYPLAVYDRIPNFKGASEAALRLSELDEFKKANVIKVNPDKSQEPVRFLALEANKEMLVPIPRLKSGLFLHVAPVAGAPKSELRTLSKIYGFMEAGKPLGVDSNIKIDLVVLGSVAVSRDGYRLGKGKGFADLEFAMMMRMGAVTQDTVVITTVHDCQVFDSLPPELFKEYDVPVDIIVTPTQTIVVNPRLKKPTGIIWNMLSKRRLRSMQVLQQLKEMDEKDGKVITLKEEDSDTETQPYRNRYNYLKKKPSKTGKDVSDVNDSGEKGNKEKPSRKSLQKENKRAANKIDPEKDYNLSFKEMQDDDKKRRKRSNFLQYRRQNRKKKAKSQIEFSLKLSNISSGARIFDLKNVLSERGVKPNQISWQGNRGICYLHFNKLKKNSDPPEQPIQVDSIMANLQELRIGEPTGEENDFIIVEPAKPISRIEVTDVTSV